MTPLIIIGASARAAAESALRAGYRPWCIDLFADRDLRALAPALRCPWDQFPAALPSMLASAPRNAAVLFTGAMENHLVVVEEIARLRPLHGSPPQAMRSVRDPTALPAVPVVQGLKPCHFSAAPTECAGRRYLLKPRRGASGAGVRFWSPGEGVDEDHYLQEFVAGTPASALYRADIGAATLLGVTEQFIGDVAFGARHFQYCGGIAPLNLSTTTTAALSHLGTALTRRHGLRGVFGVDFILDAAGDARPIEVNPRYTASTELVERATGVAALSFPLHPKEEPEEGSASIHPQMPLLIHAKAIVFARECCRVPDLGDLLACGEAADVPDAGEVVPAGRPVCTLLAAGATREACVTRLREQVERLYTRLTPVPS